MRVRARASQALLSLTFAIGALALSGCGKTYSFAWFVSGTEERGKVVVIESGESISGCFQGARVELHEMTAKTVEIRTHLKGKPCDLASGLDPGPLKVRLPAALDGQAIGGPRRITAPTREGGLQAGRAPSVIGLNKDDARAALGFAGQRVHVRGTSGAVSSQRQTRDLTTTIITLANTTERAVR